MKGRLLVSINERDELLLSHKGEEVTIRLAHKSGRAARLCVEGDWAVEITRRRADGTSQTERPRPEPAAT